MKIVMWLFVGFISCIAGKLWAQGTFRSAVLEAPEETALIQTLARQPSGCDILDQLRQNSQDSRLKSVQVTPRFEMGHGNIFMMTWRVQFDVRTTYVAVDETERIVATRLRSGCLLERVLFYSLIPPHRFTERAGD